MSLSHILQPHIPLPPIPLLPIPLPHIPLPPTPLLPIPLPPIPQSPIPLLPIHLPHIPLHPIPSSYIGTLYPFVIYIRGIMLYIMPYLYPLFHSNQLLVSSEINCRRNNILNIESIKNVYKKLLFFTESPDDKYAPLIKPHTTHPAIKPHTTH